MIESINKLIRATRQFVQDNGREPTAEELSLLSRCRSTAFARF